MLTRPATTTRPCSTDLAYVKGLGRLNALLLVLEAANYLDCVGLLLILSLLALLRWGAKRFFLSKFKTSSQAD